MTVSLITDSLYIKRMISRVSETGLGIGHHKITLHEKVFHMVGFKKKSVTEDLIQWYNLQLEESIFLDSPDLKRKMELLSLKIFEDLKSIQTGQLSIVDEGVNEHGKAIVLGMQY